jgi:hypothetical protein
MVLNLILFVGYSSDDSTPRLQFTSLSKVSALDCLVPLHYPEHVDCTKLIMFYVVMFGSFSLIITYFWTKTNTEFLCYNIT